jgi:FtsZ-interacting cell division protein ZipA
MDTRAVIVLVIVIAAIAIAAAVIISRRRRSQHLRSHFGPEYDRTVQMQGNPAKAEAVLLEREQRVKKFSLRPLPPADRERYAAEWAAVQRRFVDDPSTAVAQADRLVTTVMAARGYPMTDAEQREADISVTHPNLVQNYRAARELTQRHAAGQSSTEDLRKAMVYFRSLFDELLEVTQPQRVGETHERLAS